MTSASSAAWRSGGGIRHDEPVDRRLTIMEDRHRNSILLTAVLIGGWSRSREISGGCGQAAGRGYPVRGSAFRGRAGTRWGWMAAGCP